MSEPLDTKPAAPLKLTAEEFEPIFRRGDYPKTAQAYLWAFAEAYHAAASAGIIRRAQNSTDACIALANHNMRIFRQRAEAAESEVGLMREERDIFKADNIKQYAECEKLESEVGELREALVTAQTALHKIGFSEQHLPVTSTARHALIHVESVLGKGTK